MYRIPLCLLFIALIFFCSNVYSNPLSEWIPLTTDSKNEVKQKIKTEVEKRESFSTPDEEAQNQKTVEGERAREDSAYKDAIASLTAEFNRYKKERDDLTAQFQNSSTDFEGLQKNIKNMKNTIENYDNDITRFEQEIKTQKESFTKWLKTEKQGEAVVAVIYTRGFKDIAHELEKQADQISSPLMAEQMGTYVKSYTTVINSILVEDFIQTITEGTAKWNNEEPLRIELEKGSKGTIYLRIKRYELYPFQKPETGILKGASGSSSMKTALIQSAQDIEGFLSKNGYSYKNYDLSRAENSIREAGLANRHAEEGINAQARAYEEKISRLKTKITNAKDEKELQTNLLKKKGQQYEQMKTDIESLRKKRDESEKMFKESQTRLSEKKRIRESIIIKTALAAPKGSETAANASAEAIQDKLEEVKNDARTQHSSSTVTVINYQLKEDTAMQAVTEAKIIGLKLISFINEGDSVKVKMAFRVKTVLDESPATVPAQVAGTSKKPAESKTVTPPPESPAAVSTQVTETSKKPAESKTVTPPPLEKGDSLIPPFEKGGLGGIYKDPLTGMELISIKGGCYQMGDTFGDGDSDEKPVHEVCVDDFYMGKYEVTQKQWTEIMGSNPSYFKNCDDCPVEQVSWDDIQEYINKLNQKTGNKYRLPTEAEWEYAARSGGRSEKYSGGNNIDSVGWYDKNSGSKTHPVGQKEANGLGLYDMTGNVWEWCSDWYADDYYRKSPKNNPRGADSGQYRVLRGGSWNYGPRFLRASDRDGFVPTGRYSYVGFRLSLPSSRQ